MESIRTSRVQLVLPPAQELSPQFDRQTYVVCEHVIEDGADALREKARDIANRYARRINRQSATHPLRYRVVTGDVVSLEWPELFSTYQSTAFREWIAGVVGVPAVFPSSHLRSAININIMGEVDEIYRWHTDAIGFTVLLYLTDSREEDGGLLEIRAPGSDETVKILPSTGTLVLMDGQRCLHRVSPIVRTNERICIPMVFVPTPDQQRPDGLDEYLYR
jgi:hypothetical protein